MPSLVDEIRTLRFRGLAELDASHDYYTFSKRVWKLLHDDIREGRQLQFRNLTTKTRIDQNALRSLAQTYTTEYLASFTFQHFVSLFEAFFFDLLRLWLAAYPARLSNRQIDLGSILRLPNKDAITLAIVDKELNELKYERVAKNGLSISTNWPLSIAPRLLKSRRSLRSKPHEMY